MRLKAYYLKILFYTYNMVIRPIESFLRTLEVEPMNILGSQKVSRNMHFLVFRRVYGKLCGKQVHSLPLYTLSACCWQY